MEDAQETMEEDKYSLTGKQIYELLNQLNLFHDFGLKLYMLFLDQFNFNRIKPHSVCVINTVRSDDISSSIPHWILVWKIDNHGLLFDTYGRRFEDICIESHIPPKSFPLRTITGKYQSEYSVMCGYYICVFGKMLENSQGNPQIILQQLEHAFKNLKAYKYSLQYTALTNDIMCLQMFQQAFDIYKSPSLRKIQQMIKSIYSEL